MNAYIQRYLNWDFNISFVDDDGGRNNEGWGLCNER